MVTVTLHTLEHFPNKSIPVPCVSLPRKRLALDECIKISAHELVARRRAGSAKCKKCLQVCGRKNLCMWLPTACVPRLAKRAPPVPLPPVVPVSGLLRHDLDQEEAEPKSEEDEDQNDAWLPAFANEKEVEARGLALRLGGMNVRSGHMFLHHRGTSVCIRCGGYSMWVNRKLRRECQGDRQNWVWSSSRDG